MSCETFLKNVENAGPGAGDPRHHGDTLLCPGRSNWPLYRASGRPRPLAVAQPIAMWGFIPVADATDLRLRHSEPNGRVGGRSEP